MPIASPRRSRPAARSPSRLRTRQIWLDAVSLVRLKETLHGRTPGPDGRPGARVGALYELLENMPQIDCAGDSVSNVPMLHCPRRVHHLEEVTNQLPHSVAPAVAADPKTLFLAVPSGLTLLLDAHWNRVAPTGLWEDLGLDGLHRGVPHRRLAAQTSSGPES